MEWYDKVREILIHRGIKQVDLAKHWGLPEGTISRWLSGGRGSDRISVMKKFADYLDIHPSALLEEDEKLQNILSQIHKLNNSERVQLSLFLNMTSKLSESNPQKNHPKNHA